MDRTFSEEIQAMGLIEEAFTPLDDDARRRVLSWAAARYGLATTRLVPEQAAAAAGDSEKDGVNAGSEPPKYESLADFFAATRPKTEADRALVVGYWFQVLQGQQDFEALAVNKELKHLGHGIAHVTSAFDTLIERKPQHVIQTKKSGSARQARKKYKVTEEGKKAVQRMLGSLTGNE
jgi:hypothetical protein